jgi:hypothetical protein
MSHPPNKKNKILHYEYQRIINARFDLRQPWPLYLFLYQGNDRLYAEKEND